MIYGQLQYYNDELKAWCRTIDFYKRELQEVLMHLNVVLNFPLVSLPDLKAGNTLSDQLMVQEQRFDHIRQHIDQQNRRLEHAVAIPDKLEPSVVAFQDSCRGKMKTYEATFVKTRHDCFVFLSCFFQPGPFVPGTTEVTSKRLELRS